MFGINCSRLDVSCDQPSRLVLPAPLRLLLMLLLRHHHHHLEKRRRTLVKKVSFPDNISNKLVLYSIMTSYSFLPHFAPVLNLLFQNLCSQIISYCVLTHAYALAHIYYTVC